MANRKTAISLKQKIYSGAKPSRHMMEEFGPGKKEFIFCPYGEAVYYKKAWHSTAQFFKNPPKLSGKGICFKLCPAHEMLKNKQYEGEVLITNLPAKYEQDVRNLVVNMSKHAMRRDILDRVLSIKSVSGGLRITTSENQLAQKISRKISRTFPKAKTALTRGREGDVVRIRIDFAK